MKKFLKLLSAMFVGLFAFVFASCGTPEVTPTPETPEVTPTPEQGIDLSKYELTSIPKAIEIANAVGENKTTERYYIYGIIKSLNPQYGEMTITDGTNEIYVYGTYSADGETKFSELTEQPAVGDEIVIYANLCTYKGKPEVHSGWIQEFKSQPKPEMTLPIAGTEISIAKAIEIAKYVGENATTDRWIIKATVKTVSNPQFGEMTIQMELMKFMCMVHMIKTV